MLDEHTDAVPRGKRNREDVSSMAGMPGMEGGRYRQGNKGMVDTYDSVGERGCSMSVHDDIEERNGSVG